VGDAVMATPALRVLRELLPGAFIGALVRPGIDEILAGSRYFDEVHIGRPVGVMGPKRVAAKLRPRRYEHAVLLTNSFSTALITRVAGIASRIGYDRDGRGLLLTDKLDPPRRRDTAPFNRSSTDPGGWAPIPACEYYYNLVRHTLGRFGQKPGAMGPLELAVTPDERLAARDIFSRAGVEAEAIAQRRLVLLNPGGNKEEKRWPAERFGALAAFVYKHHRLVPLINGSPKEAEIVAEVARAAGAGTPCMELPKHGMTLAALKAVVGHCRLMVTNDTGPRHIAAALGVPVVTLFGPTDPRWTTIPFKDEIELTADPSLPEEEVTNDHPARCDIRNIGLGSVTRAAGELLRR
jgi:heptosyltransferase-2